MDMGAENSKDGDAFWSISCATLTLFTLFLTHYIAVPNARKVQERKFCDTMQCADILVLTHLSVFCF